MNREHVIRTGQIQRSIGHAADIDGGKARECDGLTAHGHDAIAGSGRVGSIHGRFGASPHHGQGIATRAAIEIDGESHGSDRRHDGQGVVARQRIDDNSVTGNGGDRNANFVRAAPGRTRDVGSEQLARIANDQIRAVDRKFDVVVRATGDLVGDHQIHRAIKRNIFGRGHADGCFEGPHVDARCAAAISIQHSRETRTALVECRYRADTGNSGGISRVDGGAARQQGVSQRRTAVVGQRP